MIWRQHAVELGLVGDLGDAADGHHEQAFVLGRRRERHGIIVEPGPRPGRVDGAVGTLEAAGHERVDGHLAGGELARVVDLLVAEQRANQAQESYDSARREARRICSYAPHCSIHIGERTPRLTPEQRDEIRSMRAAGLGVNAIARLLEVRHSTVQYHLRENA